MTGVGGSMPEHRRTLRAGEERLGNDRRDDQRAERQDPPGDPLRQHDHVGLHRPAVDPEPRTEPAKAGDHAVRDEQHAGACAGLAAGEQVVRAGPSTNPSA